MLGTRALVRVLRVLATHGGSLAVADIAQRARLTLPSVRATLRRLLALEVVTAIGAGRSMVCALGQGHPLAPVLTALFTVEQEQATATFRAVREAATRLDPKPWAVWLFGSVARGEDHATSDVDIALVTPAPDPSAQGQALHHAILEDHPSARRISIITMAPEDVRRAARGKNAFWHDMKRDAVVLLGDAPADVLDRARRARGA